MIAHPTRRMTFAQALLIVLALAAAVHARSLAFDFAHLDDDRLVIERAHELTQLGDAPKLFNQAYDKGRSNYFRPLVVLSFMLDAREPLSPAPFHRTNLLLHLLACGLFLTLLSCLGFSPTVALAVASVFAVHPISVAAVAFIPGRNDTLFACFFFGAWLSLIAFRARRALSLLWIHLACLLAALLTKETAVAIPLFLGGWIAWVPSAPRGGVGPSGRPRLRDDIPVGLGWGAVLAVWWSWRSHVPLARVAAGPEPFASGGSLAGLLMMLGKVMLPWRLSALANPRDGQIWPGVVTAAVVAAALWRSERRAVPLLGLGGFFLFLAPTWLSPTGLLLEGRLYVPLACLLLVLAEWLRSQALPSPAVAGLGVTAVLLLGARSIAYAGDYRDALAVGEGVVRTAPNLPFSYMTAGNAWGSAGDAARAEWAFRRALELDPGHLLAHNNLAVLAIRRHDYAAAEQQLAAELSLDPDLALAHLNLGIVRRAQGDFKAAAAELARALRLDPDLVQAMAELYVTDSKLGDAAGAAAMLADLARHGIRVPTGSR